jgi:hypothetical protein
MRKIKYSFFISARGTFERVSFLGWSSPPGVREFLPAWAGLVGLVQREYMRYSADDGNDVGMGL